MITNLREDEQHKHKFGGGYNNDLLAAFVVLFLSVMFWAYSADHRIEFTGLASAMGGYIETDGE